MSLKFTRKQDAHGNRGFSLHLMKVVDWPTGLNDAMSDASSNAGERYCIQTFRATGDMDLAIQAHQQGRPILERPAEPSQAQPGYVPGMPVATGTRCPTPRLLFQAPKRLRLLRLLRLLRVLWVLCLVRHGVTMFSSRCSIFSSRCPSLHSMDGTNNSGHRCHHKKIPGSNVPNRILSNGSGTAVNVVIIAVEISSEVEDMTPEADETTSVGLGFTVSASNSQFSRHHGNYFKILNFMTVRVGFTSHQLKLKHIE